MHPSIQHGWSTATTSCSLHDSWLPSVKRQICLSLHTFVLVALRKSSIAECSRQCKTALFLLRIGQPSNLKITGVWWRKGFWTAIKWIVCLTTSPIGSWTAKIFACSSTCQKSCHVSESNSSTPVFVSRPGRSWILIFLDDSQTWQLWPLKYQVSMAVIRFCCKIFTRWTRVIPGRSSCQAWRLCASWLLLPNALSEWCKGRTSWLCTTSLAATTDGGQFMTWPSLSELTSTQVILPSSETHSTASWKVTLRGRLAIGSKLWRHEKFCSR